MFSKQIPATVTFAFLSAFAAWFVADRYVGVAFYRLNVAEAVERGLAFMIVSSFAALIGASAIRSCRARAVEWVMIATALGLLLIAELAWRFIIAPLPLNGFKAVAAILDVGTPIVAFLGLAAAIIEWRSLIHRKKGGEAATA